MHGLIRCEHERRCSCACGQDVWFRDVKIKIPDSKIWPGDVNALGDFEKSQLAEFCLEGWMLTFPRSLAAALWQVSHAIWGDGKVSIERWYLSPYIEKLFNSKVIKSFVPELRSRKCFSCFGIPMFYVYMLWTFNVRITYPYHGCVTIAKS